MDQWIENKDYIESLIGPLQKQIAINQYYINSFSKTQKELTILFEQVKNDVKEIQTQQEQIISWIKMPWYKKIFKKFN